MNVLSLLGGIVLFLFGITTMSSSLQKIAGGKLEETLEKLAGNKYKGFLFGLTVTAIIQSSTATTVMVVGFVNAGVMRLAQTAGIIIGANLGTTATAQILRLGDISSTHPVLQLLRPSGLTPIFLVLGFLLYLTGKRRRRRDIGSVMIGFGIMFTGMMTMEAAVSPLRESELFRELFVRFSNPFLGLLAGIIVTAIIQSSTASVGILQAVSTTGLIPFSAAAPIILGQNVGTCFTALISSIGTNKNARRAAFIHLFYNVFGAALFLALILILRPGSFISFWETPTNRGMIANFHAFFNIICCVVGLPFAEKLVKMSERAVKKVKEEEDQEASFIDDRFLNTPTVALEQARAAVQQMAKNVSGSVATATELTFSFDQKAMQHVLEVEDGLDRMEVRLGSYFVRLANRNLGKKESALLSELIHVVGDFERIGDYTVNIAESAADIAASGMTYSETAQNELLVVFTAVQDIMNITLEVYKKRDPDAILRVEPLEEVIDMLTKTVKSRHIERLKQGNCSIEGGTILLETLVNLERIADHCSNVAATVSHTYGHHEYESFDVHAQKRSLHMGENQEFTRRFEELSDVYLKILDGNAAT